MLANGATRGPNDIITVYERDGADPLGLVRHVKTFGGDLQTALPAGNVCGINPDAEDPEFWESHDYDNGVRKATWHVDPADPDATPTFFDL